MQRVLLRYFGYTVAIAAVMAALLWLAVSGPHGLGFERRLTGIEAITSELSPVEVMQNFLLIACAAVFFLVASRDRLRRPMALSVALVMVGMLIRELDFFLDFYLVDNLWQVCCAVVISFALVYGFRHRIRFRQGWRRSWPSAGIALLLAGLMLLVPFAQLLGHEALWVSILGDDYRRVVKIAAEEFAELGAYGLITIGAVEFLYAWSRLPHPRRLKQRS